jgi:hypothetical protein
MGVESSLLLEIKNLFLPSSFFRYFCLVVKDLLIDIFIAKINHQSIKAVSAYFKKGLIRLGIYLATAKSTIRDFLFGAGSSRPCSCFFGQRLAFLVS